MDLEEAKTQETSKLQEALQEMKRQVEEAQSLVAKEREAARKAIEEMPPVIKEAPVLVHDTEKIDALTAEVENLRVKSLNYVIIFEFIVISMHEKKIMSFKSIL